MPVAGQQCPALPWPSRGSGPLQPVPLGHIPSGGSRGGPSWCPQGLLGLWLRHPDSASVLTLLSSLCVCLCLTKTLVIGFRAVLLQYDLNWLHLQQSYFQIRFWVDMPSRRTLFSPLPLPTEAGQAYARWEVGHQNRWWVLVANPVPGAP